MFLVSSYGDGARLQIVARGKIPPRISAAFEILTSLVVDDAERAVATSDLVDADVAARAGHRRLRSAGTRPEHKARLIRCSKRANCWLRFTGGSRRVSTRVI